jgi:hydroxymethylpyrimidine/phosphomethylpyrimidine kinase
MKRILTVAGSDSGGGAGIQADLKTITVLGGYAMSAVTALTAQNTVGVQGVHPVPVDFVRLQMASVLSDIGADAAKTGMLATGEIVEAVAEMFSRFPVEFLVVDPVMVAKSGDVLLSEDAREAVKARLLPMAFMVTPNLPEASVLCGFPVEDMETMRAAAKKILSFGPRMVLVKGGHLKTRAVDLLFDGESFREFDSPRLNSRNTHGTGCTFSAALATLLAQRVSPVDAVRDAKAFISRAIALGVSLGSGHGPTNHYVPVMMMLERERVREQMDTALEKLLARPLGALIPEVRSNLGYALPAAANYLEVMAVPGRITTIGDRLCIVRPPSYGASRHIARVILAAMRKYPEIRSAMNIRHSREIVAACRQTGMRMAVFDRRQEPIDVKEREGSTLEWGTLQALEDIQGVPDLVADDGEKGKEPMIRVLGKDPLEVVGKVMRISEALGTGNTVNR